MRVKSSTGWPHIRRTVYTFLYLEDGSFLDIAALLRGDARLQPNRRFFALSLLTREAYPLPAESLQLLSATSSKDWISGAEVVEKCAVSRATLDDLIAKGLILSDQDDPECAELRERDEKLAGGQWHIYAALYHFMTAWEGVDVFALAENEEGISESREGPSDEVVFKSFVDEFGKPPPHFHAPLRGGNLVELPAIRRENRFYQVLESRKTTRAFDQSKPTTLDELACVLHYVYGCQGYVRVFEDIVAIKRTSPSGGGLHPTEVYPLIVNVAGLDPGLYHYDVGRHSLRPLESLSSSEAAELAVAFTAGQRYFGSAHALFIMTARFYRSFWKYRKHTRAYSVLLMDAAHLSQTLYLVCAELGLGAFVTAAVNSIDIERRLGLDGFAEGCVAVCGLGRPQPKGAFEGPFGHTLDPTFTDYVPRVTEI